MSHARRWLALTSLVLGLVLPARGQAVEEAQLLAADPAPSDFFGSATAVSGDTAVVGTANAGAAYVYVRNGTNWFQQAKLVASDGEAGDGFGVSVAVSGDTVLVGANGDDIDGKEDVGSAYVFVRSGTSWTEQAKLSATVPFVGGTFGVAVALSGETALIGADAFVPFSAKGSGLAYVFVRNGTSWSEQAKLVAPEAQLGDKVGHAVALSGDRAVIGGPGHHGGFGAGWAFERFGGFWFKTSKLEASDAQSGDSLGISAALSGDTILLGASSKSGLAFFSGVAYAFAYDGTAWHQQAKLVASDGGLGDQFGVSVALEGETALIGASLDSNAGGGSAGSAYVFTRSGTIWTQAGKLIASDADNLDTFGLCVAMSGSTAVIGARLHDTAGLLNSGAAYVFRVLDPSVGQWIDLGQALAGASGTPRLAGSGDLIGGTTVKLTLTGCTPGAVAALVVGLSAINVPFKGGVMVPEVDLLVTGLVIDGTGKLVVAAAWPAGLPSAWGTWYQAWVPEGGGQFAASNGVESVTP